MLSSADHESSKYENISNDRYQDIQDSDSSATNQVYKMSWLKKTFISK